MEQEKFNELMQATDVLYHMSKAEKSMFTRTELNR